MYLCGKVNTGTLGKRFFEQNRSDHERRAGNSYVMRRKMVYSKSGHDQGDVQMICAIEGDYLLLADGRRRKLEKPKRKKKKHVQPTFYVEKDLAAKLQTGEYLLDADIKKALKKYQQVRDV